MTHTLDIQVRFADTDALGHLNNASYALFAETARIAFFKDAKIIVTNLILARLELDFIRQVKYGESVQVLSSVEKIGNSSMTLLQTVMTGAEVAGKVRSVVVHFDYATNTPVRVPDAARARLESYIAKPE